MHSPHPASGFASELESLLTPERSLLTFEQVYAQHYRFVWRVLRGLGLPAETVEDATQDVFVVVHRRLSEFEGRSDIRTWLFRIASWVATYEKRRGRVRPAHEPMEGAAFAVSDGRPGPFEIAARSEAFRALEDIVSRMDEEKRIVFVLMDIEEMTAVQVAELLSTNENTVYSRLRLARDQFRHLLARRKQP